MSFFQNKKKLCLLLFSSYFWLTMAFVNTNFHLTICHSFLINFIKNIFVFQNPTIFSSLLLANSDLGARIKSIMIIQHKKQGICFLKWSNYLYRPLGNLYTYLYEFCHILNKWKLVEGKKEKDCYSGVLLDLYFMLY